MGFDGLFFGRLDYQDKDRRLNTSTMEMVWHGSPNNLRTYEYLNIILSYNSIFDYIYKKIKTILVI